MFSRSSNMVGVNNGEQQHDRCFIHYSPPPEIQADGNFMLGAKEDWLERVEFLIDDLTWLLELNQKEFWDQMISNKKAMVAIISFLQEATPPYMQDTFPIDEEMWKMFQKTQYLVFLIFNRLTTCVESDSEILTTNYIGKALYNNYLITMPIILDLCLIYGQGNRAQISTIVNSVFEMQPNYTEDLIKTVPYLSKVLRTVERNFAGADTPLQNGELSKLSERSLEVTLKSLRDNIFHVLDAATNISVFLDVYTPACRILHEQLFENTMMTFYENTLPAMYAHLERVANTPTTQLIYADLRLKLDLTRVEMLKIFRLILSSFINRVVEQSSAMSELETKELAEEYVNALTAAVAEKTFVRDYHTAYPIDLDLDVLSQLCPEMDAVKCDYILEAVLACFETEPPPKASTVAARVSNSSSFKSSMATLAAATSFRVDGVEILAETKPCKRVAGVELDSLITQVKDILPHLGDGFVQSCLEHFEYASDAVINAVLEDTLPANLKAMDFSMPRTKEVPSKEEELAKGLQRLNVFDNDEFDIMTRDDVDTSRIHLGKKRDEHRDLAAMLDDKRHVTEFRDVYTKLGLVDAEADAGLYDDEYDDTYDHVDVSVAEAGEAERRPFVVPRVLQRREAESSSEGEAAGPATTDTRPPPGAFVPFVQNPEELRARAEERRLLKRGGGGGGRRGGDVVGVAKGHGQEKSVTVNRERKTQRGNQNRRSGAARKRQQGMIPS